MHPKDAAIKSQLIHRKLFLQDSFIKASTIFTYVSHFNEVDTFDIITKAFEQGKKVAVPKTYGKGIMEFFLINSMDELELGRMQILEPVNTDVKIVPDESSLIIVPAVVYDINGYRIGFGGGYYDRYLSLYNNVNTIGITYDEHLIDNVEHDEYDQKVDCVITEKRIIQVK